MFIYMFTLNWIFSMIFLFLNHPLSLGCVLLIQTILVSLYSGLLYLNFWFSYILFLVMISGMLVMFIYMTSIASNEKFALPKKMTIYCLLSLIIMIMLFCFSDNYYSNLITVNFINLNQSIMPLDNSSLSKFFNYPNMQMMIILMIYLLITLIAVVKIVGQNFGTLRQK